MRVAVTAFEAFTRIRVKYRQRLEMVTMDLCVITGLMIPVWFYKRSSNFRKKWT